MQIADDITSIIKSSLSDISFAQESSWIVEKTTNQSFGDFSSNVAMQLFRDLSAEDKSTYKNPRNFAQAIIDRLHADDSVSSKFSKIEVAGPGFINFFLTPTYIWTHVRELVANDFSHKDSEHSMSSLAKSDTYTGKTVLVEFTDPNPFKELHIGHAYSNIVGESIARLLEQAGAHVIRVCYQGDVGMHVAKSVWGMRVLLSEQEKTIEDIQELALNDRVRFLGKSYAKGATAYEEDEQAQKEIKEINFSTYAAAQRRLVEQENWTPQVDYKQFLKDSSLDSEYINELYQKGRAWSLEYFDVMYARLGMQFKDFFFESLVGEYGLQIVREFLPKGIFKASNGAIIFPGSDYGLHDRVFVNSLGLPTYEAKELGLAPEKYRRYAYDYSVIITGNEIKEYFKVLLKAMEQTNPDLAAKTRHISHGMVTLPEGKMSSRTGKVLTAEWLLDKAQSLIKETMDTTRPDWSEEDRVGAAQAIGIGAIKYAFLKQSIGGNIAFSFEESLSFTGQSGPYLQYMYVRCASILEKHGKPVSITSVSTLTDPEATALAKQVVMYPHMLGQAIAEFAPHHVALYLFELAQAFSVFYDKAPILQESDDLIKEQRLAMVVAVQQVLAHGLHILGIQTPEKM